MQVARQNLKETSKLEGMKKQKNREVNRNAEILEILEEENLNVQNWMFYLRKNGLNS